MRGMASTRLWLMEHMDAMHIKHCADSHYTVIPSRNGHRLSSINGLD
jgi:hypothetical protein